LEAGFMQETEIQQEAKLVKKLLIEDKEPIFVDTDMYKYYVEYRKKEVLVESNRDHIRLINNYKIFEFIIKNKIIVKHNEILKFEINKIINNSKDISEKHYYKEVEGLLNIDKSVTTYTLEEDLIAKKLAPITKEGRAEQDFIIIICCKKDNTKMITTNNRRHIKACLDIYDNNKEMFNNIDRQILLLPLDRFALIIDEINKIL